jgi:hypothetical protein
MSVNQRTPMALTPRIIRRIAADVVRAEALPFDVIAAWRSLPRSPYIEVVLSHWQADAERLFLGVNDWMSETQVRQTLMARLHAQR